MKMPTDPAELPGAWKPATPEPPTVDPLDLPGFDANDPAQLCAFFGPFGWADHLRRVVLSNCREMIRAQYVITETRITESRLDDLAHTHHVYVDWLRQNLDGRIAYEREALKMGRGS